MTENQQIEPADQSTIYHLPSTIASALAGLGATEDDSPLLEGVAWAMAELGVAEKAQSEQHQR